MRDRANRRLIARDLGAAALGQFCRVDASPAQLALAHREDLATAAPAVGRIVRLPPWVVGAQDQAIPGEVFGARFL